MTTRTGIVDASSRELEGRLSQLLHGAKEEFPHELEAIEEELEWRRQRVERIVKARGD